MLFNRLTHARLCSHAFHMLTSNLPIPRRCRTLYRSALPMKYCDAKKVNLFFVYAIPESKIERSDLNSTSLNAGSVPCTYALYCFCVQMTCSFWS